MSKGSVHIVGGGIVGLCSAYYLLQQGVKVTIVDRGNFTEGTSYGNAGMIVPSHFIPLASPGVISKGIKWMFNSKSPFYIKPRMSLELAQWMWKFYRSSTNAHVKMAMPILLEFNKYSKELYRTFSDHPYFKFIYEEKGLLMLYRTSKQEKEEMEMAEIASGIGVQAKLFTPEKLKILEPNIELDVLGGLYFPGDAHLNPRQFMVQMKEYLAKNGVRFLTEISVLDFTTKAGAISSLRCANGKEINVQNLLLCAGSWTATLSKKLGVKLLLQDGKGYSLTLEGQQYKPEIPTILSEAKVAITPMGADLRIGGTLEISNFSKKINHRRLDGILESVPKYYPHLPISMPDLNNVWTGYRPCTPDGMPYIGKSPKFKNVYLATGHGMMGMSLGPATGKLVSEIFCNLKPTIPLQSMRLDRFS